MSKLKYFYRRIKAKLNQTKFSNIIYRKECDFFVIGVIKGGSTALDAYMREHSELQMPYRKEIHHFNSKYFKYVKFISRNVHNVFFPKPVSNLKRCEVSPSYCIEERTIREIKSYNPEAKLILLLRNPYMRAFSDWNMRKQNKFSKLSFYEELVKEDNAIKSPSSDLPHLGFIKRSLYCPIIENLKSIFNDSQTLILKSDDLLNNSNETLKQISSFLNIAEFPTKEQKIVHKREYSEPFPEDCCELLRQYLKPDISKLENLLNWNLDSWKMPK